MEPDDRLEQALGIFLQYGFRKTSMDDIAREIGISRQALYKQYGNKQQLFEAVATHVQGLSLIKAERELKRRDLPLAERLETALNLVAGQFVGRLRSSPHGAEVIQIGEEGDASRKCQQALREVLSRCLADEVSQSAQGQLGDQIDVLIFVIKGLIHDARSAAEFGQGIRKTIKLIFNQEPGLNQGKTAGKQP